MSYIAAELWGAIQTMQTMHFVQETRLQERYDGDELVIYRPDIKKSLHFVRDFMIQKPHLRKARFVWADETEDARKVMGTYPLAEKFVFTRPTRLPERTLVSRAGAERVY